MAGRNVTVLFPDIVPGATPSQGATKLRTDIAALEAVALRKATTRQAAPAEGDLRMDTNAGKMYLEQFAGGRWVTYLDVSDRHVLVLAGGGGHYTSLSAALNALGDRAAGDEMTVIVASPLAETAQVVAKSGVNVYALPGCPITVTLAGNAPRFYISGKVRARWRNLILFSAGVPTGTNSAMTFDGAVDNTFVLEESYVENLNTVGGCSGIRIDAPAAPLLDHVVGKGGPGTAAGSGLSLPSLFAGVGGNPWCRYCTFIAGNSAFNHFGGSFTGQARGRYDYCEFLSSPLSTGNGITVRDHAAPEFNWCRGVGGDGGGGAAWGIQLQGNSHARFRHSSARGGAGAGASPWRLDIVASADLIECSAEQRDNYTTWPYDPANSGRFQPNATDPWYVTSIGLQVGTATAGATLDVGTTPGGNDVIAAAALGVAGNFISTGYNGLQTTSRKVIPAAGYLYATVNGGAAAAGSFTLHVHSISAYTGCAAIYFNSKGVLRTDGGSFVSNPASDALYINTPDTQAKNVYMRGGVLEAMPNVTPGAQMASVRAGVVASPGVYPDLVGMALVGPVVNVTLPSSGAGGSTYAPAQEDLLAPTGWNDRWEAAKAASDTTPAWMAFVGDSIMTGRNGSDIMATSVPARVRANLLGRGLALYGDFYTAGLLWNGGNPADAAWPVGSTGGSPNRIRDWLLRLAQNSAAGATFTFTSPYPCTRIEVPYVEWNNKVAAWTWSLDGGAQTGTVNTTGTKHQNKLVINAALGVHSLVITAGSAVNDASIGGFSCFADVTKGIGFARIHMPGDTGAFFAANLPGNAKASRYYTGLDAVGPTHFGFPTQAALYLNNMLVNDVSATASNYSGSVDQFTYGMKLWIEACRYGSPDCSIMFVVPSYLETTYAVPGYAGGGPNVHLYVDRVYRLARAYKCAVANFLGRWGQDPITPGYVVNDPHPTDAGLLDMANVIGGGV